MPGAAQYRLLATRLIAGGAEFDTLQAFARRSCGWIGSNKRSFYRVRSMQPSHRAMATFDGKLPGYRCSKFTARAQAGNASSAPLPPKPDKTKDQYCRMCGQKMELTVPKGEAAWRHMCKSCGYIDYLNPKMVRILLLFHLHHYLWPVHSRAPLHAM